MIRQAAGYWLLPLAWQPAYIIDTGGRQTIALTSLPRADLTTLVSTSENQSVNSPLAEPAGEREYAYHVIAVSPRWEASCARERTHSRAKPCLEQAR